MSKSNPPSHRITSRWAVAGAWLLAMCIKPVLQNLQMSLRMVKLESSQPNTSPSLDEYSHASGEPANGDESSVGSSVGSTKFNFPPDLANQSDPDPRIALFYNVYWNPQNTSIASEIVEEQMQQRSGKSIRYLDVNETGSDAVILEEVNQQDGASDAILYYFSVGAPNHTMPPCDPCHHLGHRTKGFEEFTLQAMYEYCSIRPQDTVVYFHNKGSFSSNKRNDRLRRHLTKAIFTSICLSINQTEHNLCTATFVGFPFAHTSGNFFSTKCDYVNRLIPPKDFERVKMEVHESMMQNTSLSWANDTDDSMLRESWLGLERYAMEHWIGSHPSLKPISVYPRYRGLLTYKWANKDLSWKPTLRAKVYRPGPIIVQSSDFYKRAGRLYLYEELYGEVPLPDSWVWKHYFV